MEHDTDKPTRRRGGCKDRKDEKEIAEVIECIKLKQRERKTLKLEEMANCIKDHEKQDDIQKKEHIVFSIIKMIGYEYK